MFSVEVWRGREGDEELTRVRMWAAIGHRHDARRVVLEAPGELICEGVTSVSTTVPTWAPSLQHEALNDPVKEQTVVKTGLAEVDEVLDGPRRLVDEELNREAPHRCLDEGVDLSALFARRDDLESLGLSAEETHGLDEVERTLREARDVDRGAIEDDGALRVDDDADAFG